MLKTQKQRQANMQQGMDRPTVNEIKKSCMQRNLQAVVRAG